MKMVYFLIVACLISMSTVLFAFHEPISSVRSPQSYVSFTAIPSFNSKSPVPLYDSFNLSGGIYNLIPEGQQNLNLYFLVSEKSGDFVVNSTNEQETTNYQYLFMNQSVLTSYADFVFLNYFSISPRVDYIQTRPIVSNTIVRDYDYDLFSTGVKLIFDTRYSEEQTYYQGTRFIYPSEGFYVSVGVKWNNMNLNSIKRNIRYISYETENQLYLPISKSITVMGRVGANVLSEHSSVRSVIENSSIIGAYSIPGDFTVDSSLEFRYLSQKGTYWDSPSFWYIASFPFKFKWGLTAGCNAGITGFYGNGFTSFQYSIYLAPVLAISIQESLVTSISLVLSWANSQTFNGVISFSVGLDGVHKPTSLINKPY